MTMQRNISNISLPESPTAKIIHSMHPDSRCGKNYKDGYVQGCTSAYRDKVTCETDEDISI